jgi:hypothetical protein
VSMAIDATGIAAADDIITLDAATKGSLKMDDAPGSGPQQMVSLWQNNLTALRAFRYFAFDRLRDSAVSWVENVRYDDYVSGDEL